jgi:rhodanese-related sulfurtransferase
MSGWSPDTAGPWYSNIDDLAVGHSNWSYDSEPPKDVFDEPDISSLSQDGGEILKQRVEQVVNEGFKTVDAGDVLNDPGKYHINNYFSTDDYNAFGHISGAYRINPYLLSDNTYQAHDPKAKVVTYCYTGQTSAVLTAYLRVLGYDAYSLTFGMNKLYHSNPSWKANQWGVDSKPKDLPLEH